MPILCIVPAYIVHAPIHCVLYLITDLDLKPVVSVYHLHCCLTCQQHNSNEYVCVSVISQQPDKPYDH